MRVAGDLQGRLIMSNDKQQDGRSVAIVTGASAGCVFQAWKML